MYTLTGLLFDQLLSDQRLFDQLCGQLSCQLALDILLDCISMQLALDVLSGCISMQLGVYMTVSWMANAVMHTGSNSG